MQSILWIEDGQMNDRIHLLQSDASQSLILNFSLKYLAPLGEQF